MEEVCFFIFSGETDNLMKDKEIQLLFGNYFLI